MYSCLFFFFQKSWIGSLMPLSALIGGIAGGPLIETIGRKTTILATAVPFIVCKYLTQNAWPSAHTLEVSTYGGLPHVYARHVSNFQQKV
jgi:facilitated trehalose transporter